MKWFDAGTKKMSGPLFGNFIESMKVQHTGTWVSQRRRRPPRERVPHRPPRPRPAPSRPRSSPPLTRHAPRAAAARPDGNVTFLGCSAGADGGAIYAGAGLSLGVADSAAAAAAAGAGGVAEILVGRSAAGRSGGGVMAHGFTAALSVAFAHRLVVTGNAAGADGGGLAFDVGATISVEAEGCSAGCQQSYIGNGVCDPMCLFRGCNWWAGPPPAPRPRPPPHGPGRPHPAWPRPPAPRVAPLIDGARLERRRGGGVGWGEGPRGHASMYARSRFHTR